MTTPGAPINPSPNHEIKIGRGADSDVRVTDDISVSRAHAYIQKSASGEYYITDVFGILRESGRTVAAVDAVPPEDVLSINDPAQLAEVDGILRRRAACTTGTAR